MSRSANTGFRTNLVLIPAPDWTVFGAIPTEYSLAMRKDGTPGIDDTNGIQIPTPAVIGHQVRFTLIDDGQFDATGSIFTLEWPIYYESLSSPTSTDSVIVSAIINGLIDGTDFTANGTISFTPHFSNVDPITGLAWTRVGVFARSFGFKVTGNIGTPDAGATVKFYQGIPFINYSPTALVANVTPLADGTAGQSITISGDNFLGQSANCRVRVGPLLQDCTDVVVVNINTITCKIPDLTAYNGTNCIVLVTFNTLPFPDAENIWSQNILILSDPDGLALGGSVVADITITGTGGILVGSAIPTTIVLSADCTGMYTLVQNQHFDRIYTRNVNDDDTEDVAIPTPFAKTAFIGS